MGKNKKNHLEEELNKKLEENQLDNLQKTKNNKIEDNYQHIKAKNKKDKEKSKSSAKNKIIFRLIQIILIAVLIFSGIEIVKWNGDNQKIQEIIEDISNAVTIIELEGEDGEEKILIDFNYLKQINEETVAWIRINNTSVDYPVVKTKDNDYYLTHSFDKTYNKAGWIFADYRNKLDGSDRNLIIYGHNRMDGSMFATLEKTLEEEWYSNPENRTIIFITENEETIYEIFSIYEVIDEEYYIRTEFNSDGSYQNFLNTLKRRSIYDFNEELTAEDKILTLSTCTNYNNGRIVIHAKKLINDTQVEEMKVEQETEEIE